MRSFFYCLLILYSFHMLSLFAEIQKVTISWQPDECDEKCNRFLKKILDKIPQARKVVMHPEGGYAEIFWKPRSEFTINMVRYPMARLGLYMQSIGVEASGTISHKGRSYYLHSLGDQTVLELLSPTQPSEGKYVVEANIQSHYVRDPLKSQLLELESNHELATVKGYIFLPQRQELKLIVESISPE